MEFSLVLVQLNRVNGRNAVVEDCPLCPGMWGRGSAGAVASTAPVLS
jgi:hypothetical protein